VTGSGGSSIGSRSAVAKSTARRFLCRWEMRSYPYSENGRLLVNRTLPRSYRSAKSVNQPPYLPGLPDASEVVDHHVFIARVHERPWRASVRFFDGLCSDPKPLATGPKRFDYPQPSATQFISEEPEYSWKLYPFGQVCNSSMRKVESMSSPPSNLAMFSERLRRSEACRTSSKAKLPSPHVVRAASAWQRPMFCT